MWLERGRGTVARRTDGGGSLVRRLGTSQGPGCPQPRVLGTEYRREGGVCPQEPLCSGSREASPDDCALRPRACAHQPRAKEPGGGTAHLCQQAARLGVPGGGSRPGGAGSCSVAQPALARPGQLGPSPQEEPSPGVQRHWGLAPLGWHSCAPTDRQ